MRIALCEALLPDTPDKTRPLASRFPASCTEPAPQDVQGRDCRELPDTLPIAGQAELDGVRDRPRDGEADDNGADRPTF